VPAGLVTVILTTPLPTGETAVQEVVEWCRHGPRSAHVTGVEVEPLVVFSRAWVDRPLARRKGVRVVPARMLLRYLAKLPAKLTPQEIEQARGLVARALLEHDAHGRASGGRRQRPRPRRLPTVRGRGGR